jgi:type IV pilus assembly protein PilB
VFEVMPVTPAVRELIVRGAPSRDLRRCAVEHGMLTLRQAALLKVAQGKTTLEEIRRCIPVIEAEEAEDA